MFIDHTTDMFINSVRKGELKFPLSVLKFHDNFKPYNIEENDIIKMNKNEDMNFLYVDGGIGEIISIENNSLYLLRTAYVLKKENEFEIKSYDSYLIINIDEDQVNINLIEEEDIFHDLHGRYKINFSVPVFEDMIFNYYSTIFMREAEKIYSMHICHNKMNDGISLDGIVMDGSLQSSGIRENTILDKITGFVDTNKLYLIGISKTHSLRDKNKNSMHSVMNELDRAGKCPCYIYLGNVNSADYKSDVYIAKFKSNQPNSFRIDLYTHRNDIKGVMETFMNYSENIYIPGYPLQMILADSHARVNKNEINYLHNEFYTKIVEKRPDLIDNLNNENIHDLLNLIR